MSLFQYLKSVALLLVSVIIFSACGSQFDMDSILGREKKIDDPEILVQRGMDSFNKGKYQDALTIFSSVKDRFPFSDHSLVAELKSADCQYFLGNNEEAIVEYNDFSLNHPTNVSMSYVLFQIAMSHYRQINTIDRDPGAAVEAIAGFSRLMKAFPDSPYNEEAKVRHQAAINFLAHHELYVASFYIRTKEYGQAESKLKYILQTYPESEPAAEAQHLLTAIESGHPPSRTWKNYVPSFSQPQWERD